ncbi:glycosyltransferase [Bordetella parapertussis]|uniref:Glycosyltransferase subfamily 4-like N-terminal domain-containing protein n=2 Tax=Bordetella parapertussis TaxID=519 RepID=Q7W256_BORPA|nr:glycosyltransferase [Bordetella parapertussis]AOB37523.1 glycosyltransferase [Bordetella parapertussis]AUL41478.1 glycosyltransferase [Bordetella parapertussis]AWP61389.1 glycosyltransferase [Bordetella parapertussis]AWP68885.1 glycosyltransferase [Bordetella parapertussis]AWP87479.1 glycosyltransferase [Bordetella parapertussis]
MRRVERLLLVCYYDPNGIETVLDNIGYVKAYSAFHVDILNLFGAASALTRGEGYRLAAYDGVIIHNTISYNPANLESIDRQFVPALSQYEGVKIIFKQDEQYRTLAVAEFIGSRAFDLVFTCVDAQERAKVYPPDVVGDRVVFRQMYTGYVTPKLRARTTTGVERDIDISYRGSLQPLYFGRLAYDKRRIGDEVLHAAQGTGLKTDISSRWEDRLMGEDWFRFLARSKSTLGVESGASIFDFDGAVEKLCGELEQRRSDFTDEHKYSEWVLQQLEPYEGNVYYNQISPRHFEAGAARTLQVMYEGRYSDIFQPWKHFVPLRKDLGNFQQVCEYVLDPRLRGEIVDRVYDEIIANPIYSMKHFIGELDQAVAEALERKPNRAAPTRRVPADGRDNVLLLCAHLPAADPRIGWVADFAPAGIRVHVMGMADDIAAPLVRQRAQGGLEITQPRGTGADWERLALMQDEQGAGLDVLCRLRMLEQMSQAQLNVLVDGGVTAERAYEFNWMCSYLRRTSQALVAAAMNASGYSAIVAADFDSLIAAVVLKRLYGIPVLYDAHEFWPTSLGPATAPWEVALWQRLERRLLSEVDKSISVSPQLAAHMSNFYGHSFEAVPNCEPLQAATEPAPQHAPRDECVFLFQGNFMPGRGLALLIEAWGRTHPSAILQLRGPDRPYKRELERLAERTGLLGTRIFFPEAVAENALVAAAAQADVGLVPYEPTTLNSKYCSPNKLSQYMAAGLPILANRLEFVAQEISLAGCGSVVDFAHGDELVRVVDHYAVDAQLRQREGECGRRYFRQHFHWEAVSAPLYTALASLSALPGKHESFSINVAGIGDGVGAGVDPRPVWKRTLSRLWGMLPTPAKSALKPMLLKLIARFRG